MESASTRQVRNWRALEVDAFAAELQCSELVAAPPSDVESAVNAYNTTLRALFDLLTKFSPSQRHLPGTHCQLTFVIVIVVIVVIVNLYSAFM